MNGQNWFCFLSKKGTVICNNCSIQLVQTPNKATDGYLGVEGGGGGGGGGMLTHFQSPLQHTHYHNVCSQ